VLIIGKLFIPGLISTNWNLDKYEKAIGYYEDALAIFTERLGAEHPHSAHVSKNLEEAKNALAAK
jgi:hypothetical protein